MPVWKVWVIAGSNHIAKGRSTLHDDEYYVGVAYFFLNGHTLGLDVAGATMLVILGFAMAFVFTILLRGSREL